MSKDMIVLNAIIIFYILQRVSEIFISKQNENWLKENCSAVEVDPTESLGMKVFHTTWFISLLIEANIKQDFFPDLISASIYLVLGICLFIRFYSMEKLKKFWTIKIFSLKNQVLVTDGLYKYIRHPNYLVVIIEFILLPLLFKAYFTLVVFSIINAFVLKRRIDLEERTLMAQSNYREQFLKIKKLAPFFSLLIFFVTYSAHATELVYHYKNYDEAMQSNKFVKFEGASTKFGIITTGFDGYVKDFKVNYLLANQELSGVTVDIETKTLDTNLNSRNEKMLNTILEFEKFPTIKAIIVDKLQLTEGEHTVNMFFIVKDKKVTKSVKVKIEKHGKEFLITGNTSVGIKELELPDPSIIIAKVNDNIVLKFSITL